MSKRIGPSIFAELKAAGLGDVGIAYDETGKVEFRVGTTPQQRAAVQAVFDAHDGTASILADARRARQDYINRRRDAYIAAGVTFNGHQYDTDATSINNLTAAISFIQTARALSLPAPATVSWRDSSNIDHDLTFAQLFALGGAMFERVQMAHYIARGLKDQIEGMVSEAAINAVDWPA